MEATFKHGQRVSVTLRNGQTFAGKFLFALDGRAAVQHENGSGYEVDASQIRAVDEAVSA